MIKTEDVDFTEVAEKVNFVPITAGMNVTKKFIKEAGLERVYKIMKDHAYIELEDEAYLEKEFGITKEKYDLENAEIEIPEVDEAKECSINPNCKYNVGKSSEVCVTCDKNTECEKIDSLYFAIDIKVYERDLEQSGSR